MPEVKWDTEEELQATADLLHRWQWLTWQVHVLEHTEATPALTGAWVRAWIETTHHDGRPLSIPESLAEAHAFLAGISEDLRAYKDGGYEDWVYRHRVTLHRLLGYGRCSILCRWYRRLHQ